MSLFVLYREVMADEHVACMLHASVDGAEGSRDNGFGFSLEPHLKDHNHISKVCSNGGKKLPLAGRCS